MCGRNEPAHVHVQGIRTSQQSLFAAWFHHTCPEGHVPNSPGSVLGHSVSATWRSQPHSVCPYGGRDTAQSTLEAGDRARAAGVNLW
mmetsp:Transcript_137366/g.238926  ORF Transcript_137366/g.238926 Transcript_137366/m.238926 type:complete len:87 (-) Transcript_137366:3845-4105(-)